MKQFIIVLRVKPDNELFKNPLEFQNPKFKPGSEDTNYKIHVYNFSTRELFHEAIDYLIDNGISPSEIKW